MSRIGRIRLWLASFMTWGAHWVGPREMKSIFLAYCWMIEHFPEELQRGRTYGVTLGAWGLTKEDLAKASLMHARAVEAAGKAREGIEAIVKGPVL